MSTMTSGFSAWSRRAGSAMARCYSHLTSLAGGSPSSSLRPSGVGWARLPPPSDRQMWDRLAFLLYQTVRGGMGWPSSSLRPSGWDGLSNIFCWWLAFLLPHTVRGEMGLWLAFLLPHTVRGGMDSSPFSSLRSLGVRWTAYLSPLSDRQGWDGPNNIFCWWLASLFPHTVRGGMGSPSSSLRPAGVEWARLPPPSDRQRWDGLAFLLPQSVRGGMDSSFSSLRPSGVG